MTFKLIREAQILAKLGDKAARAQQIKTILGLSSITTLAEDAAEDFQITPQHYQQWLQTVMSIAQERGITLAKRQNFNEIAFEILDNDSLVDALGGDAEATKGNILKALWQAYKVNQAHDKVQSHVGGIIDKAREDEEAASNLAGAQDGGGFAQVLGASKGVENEEQHSSRIVRPVFQRALKRGKTNPYPAGSLRAALWNDAHSSIEDEEFDDIGVDTHDAASKMPPEDVDSDSLSPDDLASKITGVSGGEDDIEAKIDNLEARVADLEAGEEGEHDEMDSDEVLNQEREANPEMDEPKNTTLPTQELNDTEYDEEEQVKSLFMKALTSPKEHMSSALKSVEDEGSKAWLSMTMPKNPHPPKSPAHGAWAKGFKNSVKTGMGFDVKPREPAKKKKR